MAKIVLHSEQRKRPALGAFNFFAQIGQENTLGNTSTFGITVPLFLKNSIETQSFRTDNDQ
mgnify:CR=1 FL=1